MQQVWTVVLMASAGMSAAEPVDFSKEILPVLSDKCLGCHGQEESGRKANLRLDTREGAIELRGGKAAVVPGNPAASRLMARIAAPKPAMLMPPPYSHKAALTAEEVKLFERWIAEGAKWGKHWSFEMPVRPQVSDAGRAIDELVGRKLAGQKMALAAKASRVTLARRLAFDLTGLPPQKQMADAFLKGGKVEDYVDALLASPRYGERMAMWWLDAARYSDTDGFQADETRTNWPWRDWVIDAFNRNMPYDKFTIEQFAGDLLPNATESQKLATSFHRQHMTNGEGGRDPEESRIDYVMDRVNTTGTVWLGLTLQCTQCHTHKFDPVEHRDYYAMNAFFNSIDESGKAGVKSSQPFLKVQPKYVDRAVDEARLLVEQRRPVERAAHQAAQPELERWIVQQRKQLKREFSEWVPMATSSLESTDGTKLTQGADRVIVSSGPDPRQDDYRIGMRPRLRRVSGVKLEVFSDAKFAGGKYTRGGNGEFLLTDVKLQVRQDGSTQVRDIAMVTAVADYSADKVKNNNYGQVKDTLDDDPRNGWSTIDAPPAERHVAVFALGEPLVLAANEELIFEMRHRSTGGQANLAKFRVSLTEARGPILDRVGASPLEELARLQGAVGAELRATLETQFLADYEPYQKAKRSLVRAEKQLKEMEAGREVPVMVLADLAKPRETNVLLRGVWDKKGEQVTPRVLPFLGDWPEDEPKNRLGLARWLVSGKNPLTARVTVNHIWQLLFGAGLVRTTEDFGLQGERPVHDELLDYLATELVSRGWDVKWLVRQIVLSDVYQQDSRTDEAMLSKDPNNVWLARGPRFRLASWMLRDAALAYAGLLNPALGGPPVRPYQPEGVWEELFMGRFNYEPSEGAAQYRRTIYAFWRRSIAPTFLFDSAQRRMCEVRPGRTNTPLHALTLLNDQTYLEASRVLAEQAVGEKQPLVALFERVLTRKPEVREMAVLEREFGRARKVYVAQPELAAKLLGGAKKPDVAALMVVASMVLNLDEAMTHE